MKHYYEVRYNYRDEGTEGPELSYDAVVVCGETTMDIIAQAIRAAGETFQLVDSDKATFDSYTDFLEEEKAMEDHYRALGYDVDHINEELDPYFYEYGENV